MVRGKSRPLRVSVASLLLLLVAFLITRNLLVYPYATTEPHHQLILPPQSNRTVLLVHVGKAGGLSLRERSKKWKHSLPNVTVYRKPFHVFARPPALKEATTYLVATRNPVNRIISTYRYSHTENCTPRLQRLGARGHRVPFGCSTQHQRTKRPLVEWWAAAVWQDCFPSAAMESFAQSVMSPWKNNTVGVCQFLAQSMVEGRPLPCRQMAAPHMEWNYEYYAKHSIRAHPEKEVWVVRLEHTEKDWNNLQKTLGAHLIDETKAEKVSHGSEEYIPSPLSTEAYQKLCCVLKKELLVYQEFLERAINLRDHDKQESMEELKTKCGINPSWEEWRKNCRERLDQDWQVLEPYQPQIPSS